ncbi:transporter substrate-binding domain-containing protein [Magnetospira sp. QH-2]|uniref:transporter substrate-binding domain-containing protein n=1 Tax=Magnetospira sp. (strain QH-2) TaxID=1288970 RepID=UPI0003E80FB5|nr:transporter substrate-binding domain-containing protein [Magnetospira sp. QH-2]CCQ73157.1 Putative sensory transduction histidine kinase [Magnetospira sp. QH-2]
MAQLPLTPDQQSYLETRLPITMCVDPDWMPFERINEQGIHEGIAADYMRLLEQRLNKTIRVIPTKTWSDSVERAKLLDCDILSMLNESPERRQFLGFTRPYLESSVVLITRQENSQITNLEQMEGDTLGLVKGYIYEETIAQAHPNIRFQEITSIDDGLKRVSEGQITAIVASLYMATHRIRELGIENLRIAGETPYDNRFRVGVRKDDPILLALLDQAIGTLTPEDHIRIRERWLRMDSKSPADSKRIPLSDPEAEYLYRNGPITMCVDPDWMPYERIDEDGNHVGMAADYINLLEKRIGTPIRLIPSANWSESLVLAKARKCDILSSLNDTPERRVFLNFTVPYIKSPLVLVTQNDVPFLDGLKDVYKRSLAVPKGYAHGEFVRRDYKNIPVVDVASVQDGLERVSKGEVFAHFGSLYVVVNEIQRVQLSNLKVNSQTEYQNRLSVGVRNDAPLLLAILDRAVRSITPEEHIQIRRKWTATRFEHGVDHSLVWQIGGAALVVILLFWLWNRKLVGLNNRLRHEVDRREAAERGLNRTNEELNRSNADLEQFAYAASHDLQEPLRMVTSYLQLLNKRIGSQLDGETRDYINFAVQGSERMATLIKGLLEYSRVGTHGLPPEPVETNELIRVALSNLAITIEEHQAEIHEPPQNHTVMVEPNQVVRVFQNLIGNALKYNDPERQPRISLSVRRLGKECVCTVKDNGIGIRPEYLERIFIMFQRLHVQEAYEGVGIGLSVVKKIVEGHGGRIWVESEPGQGSSFTFTLPLAR